VSEVHAACQWIMGYSAIVLDAMRTALDFIKTLITSVDWTDSRTGVCKLSVTTSI
jgi:hypothetical protein